MWGGVGRGSVVDAVCGSWCINTVMQLGGPRPRGWGGVGRLGGAVVALWGLDSVLHDH